MCPSTRRLLVVGVLTVLVATAGCQSFTESPATAASPAETPATATPGEPADNVTSSGSSSLADTHVQTLRRAGSATVVSVSTQNQTAVQGSGLPSFNRTQTVRHRVNFTSGRALRSSDPLIGDTTVTYRNESGASFAKSGDYYYRPEQNRSPDIDGVTDLLYVNGSALENRGRGTVDGVTGTVYVMDSIGDLDPQAYEALNGANASSFNTTVVVDDRGVASYQRLRTTFRYENATVVRVWRTRTTAVGTTTVESPAWLDEAKTAVRNRT